MVKILRTVLYIIFVSTLCSCTGKKLIKDEKTPVIIISDTTAEIDDQWMLTHQLLLENINILAIISTHYGNRSGKDESLECRITNDKIIQLTGVSNITSLKGRSIPLNSKKDIIDIYADQFFNIINSYKGSKEIIIIQSGPATEVANLLLKYPDIESRLKIVTTAFFSREIGMSYNVNNDLIAWQLLLDSNTKVSVAINQISKESFLSNKKDLNEFTKISHSEVLEYLGEISNNWFNSNSSIITSITGNSDYWPIWDEILTAYLLDYCVKETTSRPRLLDNGKFEYSSTDNSRSINWIISCDSDSTWIDFKEKF